MVYVRVYSHVHHRSKVSIQSRDYVYIIWIWNNIHDYSIHITSLSPVLTAQLFALDVETRNYGKLGNKIEILDRTLRSILIYYNVRIVQIDKILEMYLQYSYLSLTNFKDLSPRDKLILFLLIKRKKLLPSKMSNIFVHATYQTLVSWMDIRQQ